ncbi:Ornithine-carbamoyl transferase [Monocercomonoides exilis]|uniref:Ornithine-carbamoyl transferase n=1 Tax=Monocercomonoides exilis TaxID=2049356 RepID=UPI00355A6F0E|nr:Ornithine-carbamoyl transferase [Monocercomonoides exilis]|eukprot:MONOS_8743.1-p1 / transcript=MONOS_8743.1 / gene=MONOS_8743 / organism=Monocercomonoides_exilis_PA203 / gene_product=Ornithine-carbamoyl transferase [EC:2.1.3.3] / transcript_product=Ornithine-carbamoyl transferase [EC:2.1.3.3] / location=Mono_scaffold00337:47862-48934(-) / protein_length=319 / sequence_SO=supercontig / SO=protein_coding / is_pseudo=false
MLAPVRHILKFSDLSKDEVMRIIDCAKLLKAHPEKFEDRMHRETLLMLFEKPSLRTRVSFETGMTQMGGHAIFYSVADSPLGKKETFGDTGKVLSRMVNVVMARLNKRTDIRQLADNSTIPIINALDDFAHPCQMLADLLTIIEKKGKVEGLTLAYCGDLRNNVTYDLMRLASVMGFTINVAGPEGPGYSPEEEVLEECKELCAKSGGAVHVFTKCAEEAVTGADVVYCDSWMSYGIPADESKSRIEKFMPFQVTGTVMSKAKPDAIFMNCLPAARGMEQTAEVIDGPQSVVFDEAENRLHAQKALLLFLCNKKMTIE